MRVCSSPQSFSFRVAPESTVELHNDHTLIQVCAAGISSEA